MLTFLPFKSSITVNIFKHISIIITLTIIQPTRPGRPWFINPISDKNPWWLMLLSAAPAILATILIFMDQQITAVIVNRRENKLKVNLFI